MINERPTTCNICGGDVIYGKMEDFQLKPYQSGYCYLCTRCGAYIGTHKHEPEVALGILGDPETRKLRAICHEEFKRHYMSLTARSTLYYMLATEMGLTLEECHFGHFTKEQLEKSMEIMKTKWKDLYLR